MERTLTRARRAPSIALRGPAPVEDDAREDATMRATWDAWCRRVGRDPRIPPLSDAEWRAAFGENPVDRWT